MSKNSTARTGCEGDADSNFPIYTKAPCPGSSPLRSKRELEGGPFGDSPTENNNAYKEYLILMLQENDENADASNCSEDDSELYSLRNNYLEKLNIVRRRLNLIEISEHGAGKSHGKSHHGGCEITEIVEEPSCSSRKESSSWDQKKSGSDKSDQLELTTIHPFSLCFTTESRSTTDIADLEYNPPKKKSCYRLNTPKLPSSSESHIPYYTKVSLHEHLFRETTKAESMKVTSQSSLQKSFNAQKFTETKEVQCNEDELNMPSMLKTTQSTNIEENVNLFPNIVIKSEPPGTDRNANVSPESSLDMSFKVTDTKQNNRRESNVDYSLNFVKESSGDGYNTISTTSTTIVDSQANREPIRKKRFGQKNKVSPSEKLTMWDELRKLHSSKGLGNSTNAEITTIIDESMPQTSEYVTQYVTYRKGKSRVKSSPIKSKKQEAVPFGPIIINEFEKFQNLEDKFYLFNSATNSEEERYIRDLYSGKFDSSGSTDRRKTSFWASVSSCFRPIFNFMSRKR